ncbi:ABC transporter ATP-binding protein [Mycoplana dimorpha]|uniref:Amino acid/amide ABC transporter ATP-binding protein 1 (HAAT family) n=1 Tax=Mycoplana dimorpha TaxID=28320 RepID=A0A2T5AM16_MYCDI|nr:ABC transporter ATP-binding protein [Mycoplana dimorpha]PTM87763.1 amino acid/amide ABC transporter ATP-binding protein 1 (HAAT family) [Mycoplana dimorpha]
MSRTNLAVENDEIRSAGGYILTVHDLYRHFGGINAANGVNLNVGRREIAGLIGPNGSGKSTLFSLVAGTIKPDRGQIHFDGHEIAGMSPHRIARLGLARTFQIPAMFDNMTVTENLLAAAAQDHWQGAHERAADTLSLLKLEHVADNRASDLSGGQQKLLEFGRVIMRQASLILLDEVTAGVHPNIRKIMLEAIARLRERGISFLIIEHDMEMVRNVCDRIIVMDSGRVVASGSFNEIVRNSEVMQTYLGRPQ